MTEDPILSYWPKPGLRCVLAVALLAGSAVQAHATKWVRYNPEIASDGAECIDVDSIKTGNGLTYFRYFYPDGNGCTPSALGMESVAIPCPQVLAAAPSGNYRSVRYQSQHPATGKWEWSDGPNVETGRFWAFVCRM